MHRRHASPESHTGENNLSAVQIFAPNGRCFIAPFNGSQPVRLPTRLHHDRSANRCGLRRRVDSATGSGPDEWLVQRREFHPAPQGEFKVRSVIGRKVLGAGKRQYLAQGAALRFGVCDNRQTIQKAEACGNLCAGNAIALFRRRQNVADFQPPETGNVCAVLL